MKTTLRWAVCLLAYAVPAFAQSVVPPAKETIEVTATRVAEDVMLVPAAVTVIDGDELRAGDLQQQHR